MASVTRRSLLSTGIVAAGVLALGDARAQAGIWVVTAQEAALPPSPSSKAGRAISRGPAVRQVSPAGAVAPKKPFALTVEFAARGGEKIDPNSVQIAILRGDNVNITQRLKPFITATGIKVTDAMVGAGTHVLQVTVSDSGGRQSIANIEIVAR
jgi:hypothetical protein